MQQPTSPYLNIVIPTFRWHTQMFDNMFKDLTEADAVKRIEERTNNIIWILGNLVNCRYWMADVLGIDEKDPHDDLFKEGKAYDASLKYPPLEEFKKSCHTISKKIYDRLMSVSNEELESAYDFGMEVAFMEQNKLNMIGMGVDRCSYLLGQLGLLRRAVANIGTSYDIDASVNY